MQSLKTLLLPLLLVAGLAHAADPVCYEYKYNSGDWKKTREEACTSYGAVEAAELSSQPIPQSWSVKDAFVVSGDACSGSLVLAGPAGGLPAGYVAPRYVQSSLKREVECEEKCKVGPLGAVNITVGYHATPSTNIKLNPFVKVDPFFKQIQKDGGGTMCYKGCKVGVPSTDEDNGWISQVAGPNGLYRSSVDIDIQGTSQQCTEATPDSVSTSAPPPPCPGTTGTVNDATVCLPTNTETPPDGVTSNATRGNPPAGQVDPSKTPGERAAGPGGTGNGSSPTGSNGGGATGGPANGNNNGATGKGCNDGSKSPTPACSGKGTNDSDGTTPKPSEGKEQANCGAPGQPKCAIDETGTPDGKGAFNAANDGLANGKDSWIGEIEKWSTRSWDDFTFTFQLPSGCTAFELDGYNISIDVCRFQPMIHDIMSMIWAAAAVFGCMTMVFRTNAAA